MIDHRRTSWRWLAAAVTGVSLNFVQSLNPWWPVMWLAPIPLLLAALSTSSLRETLRLALLASMLGLVSTIWVWYGIHTDFPVLAAAALTAVFALPHGVPLVAVVILWRIAVRESRHWYSALIFPSVVASVDLAFSSISPHGTWASWANSQMEALPVIQTAALGGTPAVVFVITLPASITALAIARGRKVDVPLLTYGLPALLVAMALGYGFARLADTAVMPRIAVGLTAADSTDLMPADPGSAADPTLATYLRAATALSATGAEIVILPEKIEILDQTAAARVRDRLAEWARQHRTHLLAGFAVTATDHRDNRAWLFDKHGDMKADYAKRHLVPFTEMRFRRGDRDAVITLDGHTFAVAICKDMDFPRLARRYGRAGAQAVLTPAWNVDVDGVYHSRMAVLRGVEQGFSVFRAARQGVLTVSDPYGRIIAEASTVDVPVATLPASAPLGGFGTVYGKIGDAFAWTCLALVGLIACRPGTRVPWRDVGRPRTGSAHPSIAPQ